MFKVIGAVIIGLYFILFSSPLLAHVKWFVPLDEPTATDFVRYKITDIEVICWVFIGLFLVFSSVFLDSLLPRYTIEKDKYQNKLYGVLRVAFGVSLLVTAYNHSVIAPHFSGQGAFIKLLEFAEVVVAVCFILNRCVMYAAILMLIVFCAAVVQFGGYVFEYVNVVGIAVFVILFCKSNVSGNEHLKIYAVPILRVLTGVALIILGFTEKLFFAEYGEAFVETYQWNFMQAFGVEWFSDKLLVLSAGMMELVFGSILVLGTTTRLNILVLTLFMMASNLTFFIEGNLANALTEFAGHLPLIATAIILLIFGAGEKISIKQVVNVTLVDPYLLLRRRGAKAI